MTVLRTVRESPSAIFLVAAKVLGGSTETELGAADIQGTFLRLGIIAVLKCLMLHSSLRR
jgi:hypothetical protein